MNDRLNIGLSFLSDITAVKDVKSEVVIFVVIGDFKDVEVEICGNWGKTKRGLNDLLITSSI
jgi:hypothetical protein